ncbi:alkaline shock response membrane anchor protein AmaP [Streptococcus jiangjianxini]|uniref:alkaline shock response membrane anchor protein AmaP n=1 Tax=Streptococcus jiangjianxini TaxID=3161189 RepID=UPI0032EE5FB3
MAKGWKILYSLVGIVLLTVLGNVIFLNQRILRLPALSWVPVNFRAHSIWREFLAQYFLWAAIVLFILVLIGIVVIIFFPRRYSEVELADDKGKLKLKKSAIEGYVKSLVESEGLMKNPKVTASLYKKKFKVDVRGQVVPRSNVITNTEKLKKDLEVGLKAFFGVEHDVDFSVKVKDVIEEKTIKSGRVE